MANILLTSYQLPLNVGDHIQHILDH